MASRHTFYGLLVVAVAAAGCDWAGRIRSYPDSYPAPRPLGTDVPVAPVRANRRSAEASGPASGSPAAEPDAPDVPTGNLMLRRALALALARNPDLAAFSWNVRMAEAEQLQAGLLPNPELEAEFEDFAGPGELHRSDSLETTIVLSQLVELGGKREKRVALASAERRLAGWDYEARRIEVLTAVAERFVNVLAAQRKADLARETLDLARTVLETARKRVAAGETPPTEETKARIEVASGELAVKRAGRDLRVARQRLSAMWGGTAPRFDRAVGDLETIGPVPPHEALAPLAARHPEVARWDDELARHAAAADLAKAGAVPDVTIGVGYRHFKESHDDTMLAAVSVPLPLYDRNQGAIGKTRFALAKARQERRAAETRVRTALAEAYEALAAAGEEVAALRERILPAADAAFKASQQSFQSGKTGYLDVLDAERTLADLKGTYLEALASYHRARADVEGLIGQSLDAPVEPKPDTKEAANER
jgi:cobalt-zinc-cadmium efflux system outer membrane protein